MARLVAHWHRGSRSGLAVGGLVPQLVGGAHWPYVALGVGYALAAIAMFALGALRTRAVERALTEGTYVPLAPEWVFVLSAAGVVLAVGTLAVVLFVER